MLGLLEDSGIKVKMWTDNLFQMIVICSQREARWYCGREEYWLGLQCLCETMAKLLNFLDSFHFTEDEDFWIR